MQVIKERTLFSSRNKRKRKRRRASREIERGRLIDASLPQTARRQLP
jgi:hypothetical protein